MNEKDYKESHHTCCGEYSNYFAEIGSSMPNIELEAYHKDLIKKIKLSDYKGKWLILDRKSVV